MSQSDEDSPAEDFFSQDHIAFEMTIGEDGLRFWASPDESSALTGLTGPAEPSGHTRAGGRRKGVDHMGVACPSVLKRSSQDCCFLTAADRPLICLACMSGDMENVRLICDVPRK
ncbi:MAG: hypothetical protein D6788_11815 [Planctomycetota bacterium]|nr:MAG: hypothetical protein D6788_11815 [Planctomycetota bacterium]